MRDLTLAVVSFLLLGLRSKLAFAATSDIVITEFLASNDAGLVDEDGDYSDWIELHNSGGESVDLAGLALTDDAADPTKWVFPLVVLNPGEYLVVFASSKDRSDAASELHTSFALSAGGEYLGLYDTDGSTVLFEYSPEYPPQTKDTSYGIDFNQQLRFFSNPTPGQPNDEGDVPVAERPIASVDRGFYTSPFSVQLTTNTAAGSTSTSAEIRYTVDGSEPSTSSDLFDANNSIEISTTTVLRATTFASGFLPSATSTYSYIYLEDVINQPASIPGFPNGVLHNSASDDPVPLDMAMDPEVVTAYRDEIIDSLESIPTLSISTNIDNIFGDAGFYLHNNHEHKVSMEILSARGEASASEQIDAGVEAHSHDRLKRSFRLNFRTEYGNRAWETSFFQDNAPLNSDSVAKKFRTLILRGGNNRSWATVYSPNATAHTIDQFYRDSQIAMSGYGSHGTFVHLYFNGVYWGMYNLVERPDDDFMSEYFGGDNDDWFFTKHDDDRDRDPDYWTRWNYLVDELASRDLSVPANYAEVNEFLDVQNFADYIILAFFVDLADWPHNNWYAGHRNDISPLGPSLTRFFAWDGEWSLDRRRSHNTGAMIMPEFLIDEGSNEPILRIWHALLRSQEFRSVLANRVSVHTRAGGALTDEVAIQRWDTLNAYIRSAVVAESARWGDSLETLGGAFAVTRTRDVDWQNFVDRVRNILNGNTQQLLDELVEAGFYEYPEFVPTLLPTSAPMAEPTPEPTLTSTNGPTSTPTSAPVDQSTNQPTRKQSPAPISQPSPTPTSGPTSLPAQNTLGKTTDTDDCFSPDRNLEIAYQSSAVGCTCDEGVDDSVCGRDPNGGLVALQCISNVWHAVEDGPCGIAVSGAYFPSFSLISSWCVISILLLSAAMPVQ